MTDLGLGLISLYIFLAYSRVLDFRFGTLHIPFFLMCLLALCVGLSGRSLAGFHSMPGKLLLAFTGWATLGIPFSVWRTGAMLGVRAWLISMFLYAVMCGVIMSFGQLRYAVQSMALGVVGLSLLAMTLGTTREGRLFLAQGKMANPNDMAQIFLIALPFMAFSVRVGGMPTKVLSVVGSFALFYSLVQTGSRGAFLGFLFLAVAVFVHVSLKGKILVSLATIAVLVAAIAFVPRNIVRRYVTFADEMEGPVSVTEGTAIGSLQDRRRLLIDSVKLTLRHPIFGVGMDQFEVAEDENAKESLLHLPWHQTHNSFTQVSSETGIPGFLLYYGAFGYCIWISGRASRFAKARIHPEWRNISLLSFCLRASLMTYAVSCLFLGTAYQLVFPTLAGLTVAMASTIEPQFGEWLKQQKQQAAQPVSAVLAPPLRRPAGVGAATPAPSYFRRS